MGKSSLFFLQTLDRRLRLPAPGGKRLLLDPGLLNGMDAPPLPVKTALFRHPLQTSILHNRFNRHKQLGSATAFPNAGFYKSVRSTRKSNGTRARNLEGITSFTKETLQDGLWWDCVAG